MPRNFSVTFSQLLVVNADEDSSQVALMGKRGNRMHRKIKKQILEIMESIEEALQYMKRAQEADCRAMAEDCRMCTKTIADALDAEKETEKDVLDALSRFDQALDASLTFLAKRERWIFKLSVLQKQLTDVKKKIQEIKVKLEVVFLPYKASMWDSLESIWRAADADLDCDAYVVPIPYYEKLPDGEFGTMHCEVDLYPMYVPVVDWREYDVEKRRPDIIYIHNPYDDKNFITSVHPAYYSKRLRAETNMLVYVPYFVIAGAVPEHFCTTAGCVYAHKTIVQSQAVCDAYIRGFKSAFGNGFRDLKEKFIPLGSPKFDKVINTKRENCVLPQKWRDTVVGKKIVLYNTSVGAVLKNGEQYLAKLRNVLNAFRKRKKELALWWRPHPLFENTLRRIYPALAKEYQKIVKEFQQDVIAGHFIYDDSADVHRAIAVSDFMLSDPSSLISLYAATGKPMIEQTMDRDVLSLERMVNFGKLEIINDTEAWAFDLDRDGLYKLDFENNIADFAVESGCVPQNTGNKHPPTRYIVLRKHMDKLICFPAFLHDILIYDISRKTVEKIEISKEILLAPSTDGSYIQNVVQFKNKFYCFALYANALIVFDAENRTIAYHKKLFDTYGRILKDGIWLQYMSFVSNADKDGNILLISAPNFRLIKYNVITEKVDIIIEDKRLSQCYLADGDVNEIWLFNLDQMLLFYLDVRKKCISEFPFHLDGFFCEKGDGLNSLVDCGDYLLLFPNYANMIVRFDKSTYAFSEYTDMPVLDKADVSTYKYRSCQKIGNHVFAPAIFKHTIYRLDTSTGIVTEHKFKTTSICSAFEYANDTLRFQGDVVVDGKAGQRIYGYTKSLLEENSI